MTTKPINISIGIYTLSANNHFIFIQGTRLELDGTLSPPFSRALEAVKGLAIQELLWWMEEVITVITLVGVYGEGRTESHLSNNRWEGERGKVLLGGLCITQLKFFFFRKSNEKKGFLRLVKSLSDSRKTLINSTPLPVFRPALISIGKHTDLKCVYYLESGSRGALLSSQWQRPFMCHLPEREASGE